MKILKLTIIIIHLLITTGYSVVAADKNTNAEEILAQIKSDSLNYPHSDKQYKVKQLIDLVQEAVSNKSTSVTIPPGVYRGTTNERTFLTITNASNLEINAEGVTLVCEKRTRALSIDDSENVTIRGLTIDYDPLPFTQGTVIAVDPDDKWIEFKIHQGYEIVDHNRIEILDPKTRHRKHAVPLLWGTKGKLQGEGVIRVTRKYGFKGAVAVGDLFASVRGPEATGIPHGVVIGNCKRIKLKDFTLHAAPGFGIIGGGGFGDHHYDNVRVIPGPKPKGATEARLLSTSWDALQFNNLRKGPTVENCIVISAGDDSWSLSSRDYIILATGKENEVFVVGRVGRVALQPGDRVTRSLRDQKLKIEKMRTVKIGDVPIDPELKKKIETAKGHSFYDFELKNVALIEFAEKNVFKPGDGVYSPDRYCSGFVLRNNIFYSAGRPGLINGASDGLIEGNTYIDVVDAISIYPNIPAGGAVGSENIIFRNNTIKGALNHSAQPTAFRGGAIVINHRGLNKTSAPSGTYQNIIIENNIFEGVRGPIFAITSVKELRITGNQIISAQKQPHLGAGKAWGVDGEALGWFSNNEDVVIRGNKVIDRGKYGTREWVGLPNDAVVEK